jgi:hypothetical protein
MTTTARLANKCPEEHINADQLPSRAWKLFRVRRDGTMGSLFINRRQILEPGRWMKAEPYPTRGYAFRPGWHATAKKSAPHLSKRGRVWREVELSGVQVIERPRGQGGTWYLAKHMKILPKPTSLPKSGRKVKT